MDSLERVTALASIAATPWRNGGGTTRELLAWPSSADWQLRLSVADIASDGAFSAYPGVQRWFALLSGAGVVLHWPEHTAHAVTPTSGVLQFDGADPPYGQLVDGPVQDFNLMSRSPLAGLTPVQAGQAWQAPAGTATEPDTTHTTLCGLFVCAEGLLNTGDTLRHLPAMSLYYRTTTTGTAPWTFTPQDNSNALLGWWFHFLSMTTLSKAPLA